jgi:hypothetical protein
MILSARQIVDKVKQELGNAHVILTDTDYVTPNRAWLQRDFYQMFVSNLRKNKLYRWREYHDCDNKSFKYWQFASDCHAMTMLLRERQGLQVYQGISVGVFFFKQDTRFGHAINFAITENGVEFIEPQNGMFIELTQAEKDSAWFAIF